MEIRKISRRRSHSPDNTELGHFTFLIVLQKTAKKCTKIYNACAILLIKPFVWWRSRCRRGGGLLKAPCTIRCPLTSSSDLPA